MMEFEFKLFDYRIKGNYNQEAKCEALRRLEQSVVAEISNLQDEVLNQEDDKNGCMD